jgi:seryl-tRNA synthetase
MLDIQIIRQDPEAVKANCRDRNVQVDVGQVLKLDEERRYRIQQLQLEQEELNRISKLVPVEKDSEKKQNLVQKGRNLRSDITAHEQQVKKDELDLRALLLAIPNMTHPDAPRGKENKVLAGWGEPRKFDFQAKDHLTLSKALDLADFEAGAKVAGQKFYFLKNEAVLLELALVQYAVSALIHEGYTPIITPDVARNEVLEGIGFIPRGPETQIYSIENTDLSLIATAEITLGGMHQEQILDELQLPIKYVGLSHCFRTEAGAPGRDTRGLYRVHQFTKVEMFVFCLPSQSDSIHEEMLRIERSIFEGLGLPYQVVDTCTAELGGPAYRKYDLEVWMPGRGQAGEFGEVTSTSNCTAYQARRLNIRYKTAGKKPDYVHTLNGTAVAVSRAILAILENYQQADGSILVPEVLRPVVGKEKIRPRQHVT